MTNTTRPSLYEVGVEGAEIESILMENDGELTPELEARLDAHLASGKNKIVAAAMVVQGLEASKANCLAEALRLMDRANAFERNAKSLKARILFAVDEGFDGKIKTDLFTIWGSDIRPNREHRGCRRRRPWVYSEKLSRTGAHEV